MKRFRGRGERERRLDAELRDHLERLAADYMREGVPEEEARRRARLEFGGLDQMKEECRDARGSVWLEAAWQDVRYALRMLRKSPAFTAAVIGTLALGLGANTAIFSVVYAALLRPLPYREPGGLVLVNAVVPQLRGRFPSLAVRARDFDGLRRSNRVFEEIAAVKGIDLNLTGDGDAERVSGARVSASFFPMVGVAPALGRAFLPEEDQPGRDRVVVISHGLWMRRYGGDPGVVNRTISLDGESYNVVGVAPADFLFPSGQQLHPRIAFGPRVDVWKPMAFTPRELGHMGNWGYGAIARLKPGVTVAQARENLDALAATIPFPDGRTRWRTLVTPLSEVFSGNVRQGLIAILGATGLLLLIACVNLANLLLSRMSARGRELATRAALGAPRSRLVRQLLTETLTAAALGGAASLPIAYWGTRVLSWLAPSGGAMMRAPEINGPVLLYAAVLTLATGLAFGLAPALRPASRGLQEELVDRAASSGRRSGRMRRILVAAEVALSTGLLASAGLLLHSFVRLMNVDKGFAVERVLAADVALPAGAYSSERTAAFYRELNERVRALPGVMSAGVISAPPLGRSSEAGPVYFPSDTPERTPERPMAAFPTVTRGYFAAMGVPLLAGRAFEEQEPAPVLLISVGLARRLWPGEPADRLLGRPLKLNHPGAAPARVVGVTGDVRADGLDQEASLTAYRPASQAPWRDMTLIVRTSQDPEALAPAIRRQVAAIDRNVPVSAMNTMQEIVSQSVAQRRFQMTLVGLFAALSLILAAVGIYGVASYAVARQTREIGLRMALGAREGDVLRSALIQGLGPVLAGLLAGVWAAGAAALWMRNLLYGIEPLDPAALGGACAALLLCGAAACYAPARRAARVDPVIALRCE